MLEIIGFGWIRNDAMNEARETVTDRAGDLIKETLHENPKLIVYYVYMA